MAHLDSGRTRRRERSVRALAGSSHTVLRPVRAQCASAGFGRHGDGDTRPDLPVQRQDDPCPDQPYSAALSVLDSDNVEIVRVTSGTDGKYALPLAPGSYTIVPLSPPGLPFPFAGPVAVEVDSGTWSREASDQNARRTARAAAVGAFLREDAPD